MTITGETLIKGLFYFMLKARGGKFESSPSDIYSSGMAIRSYRLEAYSMGKCSCASVGFN